jgi:hypothetical protein
MATLAKQITLTAAVVAVVAIVFLRFRCELVKS